MSTDKFLQLAEIVAKRAETLGINVYLVGGAVRDMLLFQKEEFHDLDFTIEGSALKLAQSVAEVVGGKVVAHPDFLTANIKDIPDFGEVDFATCRTEKYPHPGSLPKVTAATINEDLRRRDFSINAMAINLNDLLQQKIEIIDPQNGKEDLKSCTIRVLHEKSFIDDPTRLFRCLRYCGRLQGQIQKETEKLIDQAISKKVLDTISCNRLLNELKKIWNEAQRVEISKLLFKKNIIPQTELDYGGEKIHLGNLFIKLAEENKDNFRELTYLLYLFSYREREELVKAAGFRKEVIRKLERAVLGDDPEKMFKI